MNNNMTPTPWLLEEQNGYLTISHIEKNGRVHYIISDYDINIDPSVGLFGDPEQDNINFSAMVSAVNSTYGNGINPEAVKEMYDTLKWILEHDADDFNPLEVLFNKAKAVLDKAKL